MYNCKAWSLSFSLLNFADEFQYLLCLMTEIFVAEFVSVYLHIGICGGKLKQHTQRRIQGSVAGNKKRPRSHVEVIKLLSCSRYLRFLGRVAPQPVKDIIAQVGGSAKARAAQS